MERETSGRTLLSLSSTSPERSRYRNLVKRERGEFSSLVVKRDEEGENYRSPVRRERGEGGDYRSLVRRERGVGGGDYKSLVKRGERGEKYRSLVRREQRGEGGNYRSLVRREASGEKPSKVLLIQPEGGGGGGEEGKTEGSSTVKKDSAGSTGAVKKDSLAAGVAQQGDTAAGVKSIEGKEEEGQAVSAPSPSPPHTTTDNKDKTPDTLDRDNHGSSKEPVEGPSGLSPDAMLRGFYVFIGIGTIVLVYIAIKFVRLRRRRAPQKYGLLSHTEDQEMFPLAADDGDDEEIYNASDHQHILK
ncbi:hypothetical protein Pmani_008166 [Petrolisthes manimaculis]|uniref:Uncharacterized protein n=1 Tax=Petrolisthes manimaculis TaxID=1843537 RepID=A0AAE1Q739_9EUCA|nr:hypothetical protein Pmani_008166 [Petrolisthes manimaculis]